MAGYLLGGGVNWLGTYNKYGYGAENVLAMRAVLSDGRIADVTPEKTEVGRLTTRVIWLCALDHTPHHRDHHPHKQ